MFPFDWLKRHLNAAKAGLRRMATTSSYRTPHEVRVAIHGMGGSGDWLQRAIEHHQWMFSVWDDGKRVPTAGPPSLKVMAEKRYEVVVGELRKAGLRILGQGSFGTVFELRPDDPWVYKLVAAPRNDAYLAYVRWAREQRTGPAKREAWVRCLPRVKILFEDKWFALIRVERLVAQCHRKATAYGSGETISYRSTPDTPRFEPYRTATARILAWSQFCNDMYVANIMLRPTKCGTFEPVHTDPVC